MEDESFNQKGSVLGRDHPAKPLPGRHFMRQLNSEESKATGLERDTYIMTEPETGMITFWQRLSGGRYKPLFESRHHDWAAEALLEEFWAKQNDSPGEPRP